MSFRSVFGDFSLSMAILIPSETGSYGDTHQHVVGINGPNDTLVQLLITDYAFCAFSITYEGSDWNSALRVDVVTVFYQHIPM